jgi:hypothetical protein
MPYNNPSEAYGSEVPVTAADLHAGSVQDPNAPATPGPVSPASSVVRPAGWVDADRAEEQNRQFHRQEIISEEVGARQRQIEAEIDRRISQARGDAGKVELIEMVEADVNPDVASE